MQKFCSTLFRYIILAFFLFIISVWSFRIMAEETVRDHLKRKRSQPNDKWTYRYYRAAIYILHPWWSLQEYIYMSKRYSKKILIIDRNLISCLVHFTVSSSAPSFIAYFFLCAVFPCIPYYIRISSVPCVCPFHSPLIFSFFRFLCFESPASITSFWHGNAISSSLCLCLLVYYVSFFSYSPSTLVLSFLILLFIIPSFFFSFLILICRRSLTTFTFCIINFYVCSVRYFYCFLFLLYFLFAYIHTFMGKLKLILQIWQN